jgi:hypothetical protein
MELANEMGPVVAVQVFRAGAHPEAMNESEPDDESGGSGDGQRIEGCAVEIAPMQCETPIEVAATAAAELERLGAVLIGRDD